MMHAAFVVFHFDEQNWFVSITSNYDIDLSIPEIKSASGR
jgi:hypothetical protein